MKSAEMKVLCFDEHDVIATSELVCESTDGLYYITNCIELHAGDEGYSKNRPYVIYGKIYTYDNGSWTVFEDFSTGMKNKTSWNIGYYHVTEDGAVEECVNAESHNLPN